jgi:hypothetical protein
VGGGCVNGNGIEGLWRALVGVMCEACSGGSHAVVVVGVGVGGGGVE